MTRAIICTRLPATILLASALSLSVPGVWADSGQCLSFDGKLRQQDSINTTSLSSLAGFDSMLYAYNLQRLSVGESADGRVSLRQKMVPDASGSERVLAGARLEPARTYRLRQSVLFEPGFDWGGENEGGKLGFGLAGGSAASGGELQPDGFTARFMWRGHGDGSAGLSLYSYAANRVTSRIKGQSFGEDLIVEDYRLPIGEWIDMEMEVTVNSTLKARDGSVSVRVNGKQLLQRDDMQWQAAGDQPEIDQLIYSTFYGGSDSSWSPENTTYIRFADVCWSIL